MNDGQALLEAILDEPGDMLRRMIYADWLEENGLTPARVRLIRGEGEITPDEFRADFPEEDRIAGLTGASVSHYEGFGPPNPKMLPCSTFRFVRGFLDVVAVQMFAWLKYGKYLARHHPLGWVTIIDRHPTEEQSFWSNPAFSWAVEEGDSAPMWRLPEKIAARLNPKPPQLRYDSEADARTALANACLSWAHSDED